MTTDKQIHLTEELAHRYMREAVIEYGEDFVYEAPLGVNRQRTCVYVSDNKASCLIGQVLVRAGVPIEEFGPVNNLRIERAIKALSVLASHPLIYALAVAQDVQDCGRTWGEALWRFQGLLSERQAL